MDILTTSEKKAVLILVIVLIGAGLTHLFYPSIYKPDSYDYSESDSIFVRISNQQPIVDNQEEFGSIQYSGSDQDTVNNKSYNRNYIININTASAVELQKLPGIGPVIANRILEYRKYNKNFTSKDELARIRGIGIKKVERIKKFIRIK